MKMNHKKMVWMMIVGLLVGLMMVNTGFSQTKPDQTAGQVQRKVPVVTMTAKIINDKTSGGYLAISQKPVEEYKILNVNEDILSDLAKKGEPVTINGRLPRGAYFLVIDKINGKEYPQ
jgi:hypothetical protein